MGFFKSLGKFGTALAKPFKEVWEELFPVPDIPDPIPTHMNTPSPPDAPTAPVAAAAPKGPQDAVVFGNRKRQRVGASSGRGREPVNLR